MRRKAQAFSSAPATSRPAPSAHRQARRPIALNVFDSIDPAGVTLLKQWLRRFTEQGRTVFITTHVLDTVERL